MTMTQTAPDTSLDTRQDARAGNFADHAAHAASKAIRKTQRATGQALDHLDDKVESARSHASPLVDRWTRDADAAARRSARAVRETALRARGATTDYVRDEPIKAVLLAAGAGALLLALIQLLRRD